MKNIKSGNMQRTETIIAAIVRVAAILAIVGFAGNSIINFCMGEARSPVSVILEYAGFHEIFSATPSVERYGALTLFIVPAYYLCGIISYLIITIIALDFAGFLSEAINYTKEKK